MPATMQIVAVTIFVKPENVADFIAATLDNARNTRKEPGNLRFDVSRAAASISPRGTITFPTGAPIGWRMAPITTSSAATSSAISG